MTDEQIKQNAEEYINNMPTLCDALCESVAKEAYIAGAHSRDEEIEKLERRVYELHVDNAGLTNNTTALSEELNKALIQLSNPWISVKDRLPKDGDIVLTRSVTIIEGGGERYESVQHLEQKYIGRWITDDMKQHRMGGILFDTIVKVTHWMPIPQIKKGE